MPAPYQITFATARGSTVVYADRCFRCDDYFYIQWALGKIVRRYALNATIRRVMYIPELLQVY